MLPYQTLQEAELELRRELSYAEKLWFDYSRDKSDYYLYCHTILFLFVIFSIVPLPVVFMEIKKAHTILKYKIQPKVKISTQGIFKCYKDVMITFCLVVGPLQLVSVFRWLGLGQDCHYHQAGKWLCNYWCIS